MIKHLLLPAAAILAGCLAGPASAQQNDKDRSKSATQPQRDNDKQQSSDQRKGDNDKQKAADQRKGDNDKQKAADQRKGDNDKQKAADQRKGDNDKQKAADQRKGDNDKQKSTQVPDQKQEGRVQVSEEKRSGVRDRLHEVPVDRVPVDRRALRSVSSRASRAATRWGASSVTGHLLGPGDHRHPRLDAPLRLVCRT